MEIKMMKGPSEQRDLMIKQLIEGIEAAKQLQKRILITPRRDDYDTNPRLREDDEALNHSLLDKMLSSFDKTISIAKLLLPRDYYHHHQQQQLQPSHNFQFEGSPPHSLALSSPRSENSHHQHLHLSKKRKTMPKWSKTVDVRTTKTLSGLEGPLDDGYTWRKYGQKDILGAKHPRGYYRCTHRHTQGCAATKQVQRLDEDPSIYQIIYRGEHTCSPLYQAPPKPTKAQIKIEPSPQSLQSLQAQPQVVQSPDHEVFLALGPDVAQSSDHEVYLDLGPDGALNVEPSEDESPAHLLSSFPCTPALPESQPIDNCLWHCSPTFGSPATRESNPFPMSPCRLEGPGNGLNVQTSESDLNGSISGPNSVSNSPIGCDFEFLLDQLPDIDAVFTNFGF